MTLRSTRAVDRLPDTNEGKSVAIESHSLIVYLRMEPLRRTTRLPVTQRESANPREPDRETDPAPLVSGLEVGGRRAYGGRPMAGREPPDLAMRVRSLPAVLKIWGC